MRTMADFCSNNFSANNHETLSHIQVHRSEVLSQSRIRSKSC